MTRFWILLCSRTQLNIIMGWYNVLFFFFACIECFRKKASTLAFFILGNEKGIFRINYLSHSKIEILNQYQITGPKEYHITLQTDVTLLRTGVLTWQYEYHFFVFVAEHKFAWRKQLYNSYSNRALLQYLCYCVSNKVSFKWFMDVHINYS